MPRYAGRWREAPVALDALRMRHEGNRIVEQPVTWVSVAEAARYAGVSRGAVERCIATGAVPTSDEGRTRAVALESVLMSTTPRDVEQLRGRLERAAHLEDAPAAVREWGE